MRGPETLADPSLSGTIQTLLDEHNLAGSAPVLEVSENRARDQGASPDAVAAQLTAAGGQVASTTRHGRFLVGRLRSHQFDEVKIAGPS